MGKVVTVTLDEALAAQAETWIAQGDYESLDEIVGVGLRAVEARQVAETARLKALVQEALDDPGPYIPIDEAFAQVEESIRRRYEG